MTIVRRGGALLAILLAAAGPQEPQGFPLHQQEPPKIFKQDPKKPAGPDPFQLKVDEAIRKGIESLKAGNVHPQHKELVLLTFVHAGVPEDDPKLQAVLKHCLLFKNDGFSAQTYNISILAMALEELDRVTYQKELHKCAQFLVDNQCQNGQWGYGTPTTYPADVPTVPVKTVATGKPKPPSRKPDPSASAQFRTKPPVRFTMNVKAARDGGAKGDNSNSQYAALGLRACHDAGIVFPREGIERAQKWWESCKSTEPAARDNPYRASKGWGYSPPSSTTAFPAPNQCSGAMTAGAIGARCIYQFMLGNDWKADPAVLGGMGWMVQHFSVTENPSDGVYWHYYYLYALERLGMLYGTASLGQHDWYLEGAKYLVDAQKPDGSWNKSKYHEAERPTVDTCYAILFLRRATRPLQDVASEDRYFKK